MLGVYFLWGSSDLEIAAGATNAARLEQALKNAEFESSDGRTWRWQTRADESKAIVKFELLTDLEDQPASATVNFAECDALGAVNLRGTRFASRDFIRHPLTSKVGGVFYNVEVNVAGVAGFLLAKSAAAYSRRKEKDWYDIAFVPVPLTVHSQIALTAPSWAKIWRMWTHASMNSVGLKTPFL